MKRLASTGVVAVAVLVMVSGVAAMAAPPTDPVSPPSSDPAAAPVDTSGATLPVVVGPESGAATPAPPLAPSAPLVLVPAGCPTPPIASVVFVATLVAKDKKTARYRVESIRAGGAASYIVTGLTDVRYDDETQYLDVGERYLVGAVPATASGSLTSKVRATPQLFGGNAVIGLTEKNTKCPVTEDPVRTLRFDGSEVQSSLFTGLKNAKREIVMAFVQPAAVAFGIVLALATIRWLFTGIFVSVRNAADGEPIIRRRVRRRRLGDFW